MRAGDICTGRGWVWRRGQLIRLVAATGGWCCFQLRNDSLDLWLGHKLIIRLQLQHQRERGLPRPWAGHKVTQRVIYWHHHCSLSLDPGVIILRSHYLLVTSCHCDQVTSAEDGVNSSSVRDDSTIKIVFETSGWSVTFDSDCVAVVMSPFSGKTSFRKNH